jgi:hypothetical protein
VYPPSLTVLQQYLAPLNRQKARLPLARQAISKLQISILAPVLAQ